MGRKVQRAIASARLVGKKGKATQRMWPRLVSQSPKGSIGAGPITAEDNSDEELSPPSEWIYKEAKIIRFRHGRARIIEIGGKR